MFREPHECIQATNHRMVSSDHGRTVYEVTGYVTLAEGLRSMPLGTVVDDNGTITAHPKSTLGVPAKVSRHPYVYLAAGMLAAWTDEHPQAWPEGW